MLEINSQSVEYVKVPVTAKKGGVAFDPTGDVVQMTFSTSDVLPANPTWYAASWEEGNGYDLARCLVGPSPGLVVLGHGTHNVFIKITDNPESPVIRAGAIEVS